MVPCTAALESKSRSALRLSVYTQLCAIQNVSYPPKKS
jgi:hypothetical protein